MRNRIPRSLARLGSARGAVYVEFVVVVVPMFALFWGLVQLNGLLLTDLVTQHAAVTAVRAAIVCEPDNHDVRAEDGQQCADAAVKEIFGLDTGKKTVASVQDTTVTLDGASESGSGSVKATVAVTYQCQVPFIGGIVCGVAGGSGGTATITRSATLPNQGHFYKY